MNTKTLIAALIGGIAAFLLGWVVFGMMLKGFYEANTTVYEGLMKPEEEMNLGLIFLSNLCWSCLLAYVFSKANVTSAGAGAQMGFIIGLLAVTSFDLFMYTFMNLMSGTAIIVDILANAVVAGII